MTEHIYKCPSCQEYTMEKQHCHKKTILARPPKFSLEDKYGYLRRKVKKEEGIY